MTEAAAAASKPKGPSKAARLRAAREAAARVAGWTHAASACGTLLWSLEYRRCAELCPHQVAPRHEAEFVAIARQTIAKLEALIAIAEARRAVPSA